MSANASMSDEKTIKVEDSILSQRPDGSRILSINNSGKNKMDLKFSAEQWQKLGESAKWFAANVPNTSEETE